MDDNSQAPASSPEAVQVEEQSSPLESLSSSERDTWLKTGELPKPKEGAESAPAGKPEEDAGRAGEPPKPPESGTGQETQEQARERSRQNAETRKRQLAADIQEHLERRERARQEAEREEARLAALKGDGKPAPPPGPPQPAERPKRPRMDQFETLESYEDAIDKYEEALAEWKVDQRLMHERAEYERSQQSQTIMRTNQEIRANWEKRLKETTARHPDFKETVEKGSIPLNPIMDGYLMESEIGPELVYHFAKNPADAERIAVLGPYATARELAFLERQISESLKTSGPRKLTGAPPPVTELPGRNAAPEDEVAAAVKAGDFRAYQRAQNARDNKR